VPERAGKVHVALGDLQVGGADAGEVDAEERLAALRFGVGAVALVFQRAVKDECLHETALPAGAFDVGLET
jgi:hypothetical protein